MGQAESLFDLPKPTWHEVEGTRTADRGPAHLHDDKPRYQEGMTLYTNLTEYRRQHDDGSRNLFGTRKKDPVTGVFGEYEWVTYSQFLEETAVMTAAMVHELGLKRQEPVGVFSKNRYEWVLVEHGVNRMAYQLVPLYDSLGPGAIPFIVNQTEMRVVFVGRKQFAMLAQCISQCPTLQTIVLFDDVDEDKKQEVLAHGVKLKAFSEILEAGKKNPVEADPPSPSDIATICYTSGTTGDPKGAILTHKNLTCVAVESVFLANVNPDDVHFSFLPLPHVLERLLHNVHIACGGSIGFYQGDVAKLLDDLGALRPTTLTGVPRVFNRIYDRISMGVEKTGGIKRKMFEHAFATKRRHLEDGYVTHALYDKVVFQKLRDMIGGRVRLMVTGSAPLTQDCREFLQIVFSCPIIEGYGLTEVSAVAGMSTPAFAAGPHTFPVPSVEMCLANVPDMNYTSDDKPAPRGEICIRGPSLFSGYYKDPERTAEAIDADGWFHTGDIGRWNADGTLSIIDRKKNIFKLSQGEYIAPEKIENVYMKSSLVAQVFVHGYSTQSYVLGVVVPDPEAVTEWAEKNVPNFTPSEKELQKVLSSNDLKKAIEMDLEAVAVKHGLFRFERVQKIHVDTELWSAESNLMTPTFKLKRPQLVEKYQAEIDAMYGVKTVAP